MTPRTERLQVRPIPEQGGVSVMLHDVIDSEILLDLSTVRTGIGRLRQDEAPQVTPLQGVIPLAHVPIGAGMLQRHGMRGAAARLHERGTARIGAGA